MITKDLLENIGKRKKLTNKEHIEKDYFQDIILFSLVKKTNQFVFKGGTALYKLYNLPRFSEDLDFSLSKKTDLPFIEKIIKEVAHDTHFSIQSIKKTKDSLLVKLSHKGILTTYNTLRIDINFKNEVLQKPDVKNYVPSYIDINPFALRVLTLEEIISEKIHSLFARQKARDLFDLFFLLRISPCDKELIIKKLAIFHLHYDYDLLEKHILALSSLWEKELRPFILGELPDFTMVKDFVLTRLQQL